MTAQPSFDVVDALTEHIDLYGICPVLDLLHRMAQDRARECAQRDIPLEHAREASYAMVLEHLEKAISYAQGL